MNNEIYNIKYVDASYSYKEVPPSTEIKVHECYGYLEKENGNFIISYIKPYTESPNFQKQSSLSEGIVIPENSLISKNKKISIPALANIPLNTKVEVYWKDVVHFLNKKIRECSEMYSEGVLFRADEGFIILKNPETIRIKPTPIKNHPQRKPNFYKIPFSFIKNISSI